MEYKILRFESLASTNTKAKELARVRGLLAKRLRIRYI